VFFARFWCCWMCLLISRWWMKAWLVRSSTASRNCAKRYLTTLILTQFSSCKFFRGFCKATVNVTRYFFQAKLVPTDEITVFLQPTGGLVDICRNFATFIYSTIKQPLALYPVTSGAQIIVEENNTVLLQALFSLSSN
jgi:hypothetical protein